MAWIVDEVAKVLIGIMIGVFLKKARRIVAEKQCMITGCTGVAQKRGVCLSCYARAKELVSAGETTWDRLAERGLVSAEADSFDSAYERAMDDNYQPKEYD